MERRRYLSLAAAGCGFIAGCGSDSNADNELNSSKKNTSKSTPINPVEHEKLIGAHYYPWYNESTWTESPSPGSPVLGEYESDDESIVNRHIRWAVNHGINWFNISWWGPDSEPDRNLRRAFLNAELSPSIYFSILYESKGRLVPADNDQIDFDNEQNRRQLRRDFAYLSNNHFNKPTYLRIDDRPVVFLFLASQFRGSFPEAIRKAKAAISEDVYLIGDVLSAAPNILHTEIVSELDAVSMYNLYTTYPGVGESSPYEYSKFIDHAKGVTLDWHLQADFADLDYIPNVIPGYNDTLVRDGSILKRSPNDFKAFCKFVTRHFDLDLKAVLITSFNEWPEYTAIEPGRDFGQTYLDIIKNELAIPEVNRHAIGNFDLFEMDFNKTIRPIDINEGSPDSRHLAFRLSELIFQSKNGTAIKSYDLGNREDEPHFLDGIYGPERNPGAKLETWRWLGGPNERTAMYVEIPHSGAASAELVGVPVTEEITAEIRFNEQVTDHVSLGRCTLDSNNCIISLVSE